MASLYRPVVITYALPDGKHSTPDGARGGEDAPGGVHTKGGPDGGQGRYRDANRRCVRVALCPNKEASRQMLGKLATDARLAERGMIASFEKHHKRPLSEHLADFEKALIAKGGSRKHVAQTVGRVRRVFDGWGFLRPADIVPSRVWEFLADLQNQAGAPPPLPSGQAQFKKRELAKALNAKPSTVAAIIRRHGLCGEGKGKARRFSRAT